MVMRILGITLVVCDDYLFFSNVLRICFVELQFKFLVLHHPLKTK